MLCNDSDEQFHEPLSLDQLAVFNELVLL